MTSKERFPKVVRDDFTQCELCKTWLRLSPVDEEDGMRTVPLMNDLLSVKDKWICPTCWDKRDPYQHEENQEMWDRYERVQQERMN